MIRVLATGGRDYSNKSEVRRQLLRIHRQTGFDMIVAHGNAPGLDSLVDQCCTELLIPVLRVFARWDEIGKGAGHERNARMLRLIKPQIGLVFPGGTGTANMRSLLVKAGVEIRDIGR